jgi:hypothetical protein
MRRINLLGGLALAAAVISLTAVGAAAAPARSATSSAPSASTSFTVPGGLYGVAATSAGNAWAVGITGAGKTLIVHWNGRQWSQVTSPKPVYGYLAAVAAVSADNVWAVGGITNAKEQVYKTLVMHWNGKKWTVQSSAPTVAGTLNGVTVRGNSVWAVGGTNGSPALLLHGVGNRWYVVPTDGPADSALTGVAATGGSMAWATGVIDPSGAVSRPFLLRWNGSVWKTVSDPLAGAGTFLNGIAAGPAGDVWVVGCRTAAPGCTAASMLWNGKTWRTVPVGPLPWVSGLFGAAFVPGGTAWAVGDTVAKNSDEESLILRWTGHAWAQVSIPADGGGLQAVAATSTTNAWAVGNNGDTLILHWNGKTWR